MRVCDLTTPVGRLARAAKQTREAWGAVEEHWRDQQADQFEAAHVDPLLQRLTQVAAAVQRFADFVRQAERECGEEFED